MDFGEHNRCFRHSLASMHCVLQIWTRRPRYCASNPEDKGCAQLSFVFTRRAAESQSISFHVAKDVESVTFEPSRLPPQPTPVRC